MTKCNACELEFTTRWLREHRCIGSSTPSIQDILRYTGAVADDHGCLIPTTYTRRAGQGGGYWLFPRYVKRMLGESYIHRAVLTLKLGRAIGSGLDASHACGDQYENKHCLNPDHLVEETRKQNHARMASQTRSKIARAGGLASPTQIKPGSIPWNKGLTNASKP